MLKIISKASFTSAVSLGLFALLPLSVSLSAHAESFTIGALTSGQVSQVFVKEGDKVSAGQKLLNLDAELYQAKMRYLQAQVDLQQAKFKDAKIELDTALDLFDRTVTSRRTLDAAKLAFSIVEAELARAKAEVAQHKAWEKYVYIKAPRAATISKLHVHSGATVFRENQPLIELQANP